MPMAVEEKKSSLEDNTHVLKGINLEIREGEFMVLVGPSGCGKSTLLRLIAGLEEITAGKICIGDRTVNNLPPKSRDIAMVFQNYALYPHLRVYDNIAFGLRRMNPEKKKFSPPKILGNLSRALPPRLRYLSQEEKNIQAKVLQVAQLLQIDHLLDRLPKQLSGGQKQRVALGRAIARNPQAFLMDEPLSNLDAKLRTETRSQIVKLQKQLQVTTIYVTHDQTEAMTMGDRIAIMNNGEIQQVATPLEVYRQPANKFVAQFIGSPAMNFIEMDYLKQESMIIHHSFKIKLPPKYLEILANYNYEKIELGIRPEHFYITQESDQSLFCTINMIESLGNETLLGVTLNSSPKQDLQIRIFGDDLFSIGEQIHLGINLDKVSFFDSYQGRNIFLI
ncbi:carbohydrate ABC transporter ATP-binding protein, CUT1 family [Cyanobacterium stanieri PCC 7202]|uniref:Carbohydrate ABC transporter ATP-binding protein, CUT1 family n=1 Tax=Cyanobacterium stanieri (strain ATCC 29140 / PCC 7202) TaxID=292563 RepID=K9YN08_CYASC|nr:carbohydrate ABC transporter ATP-binding protein, CUT1 family [Cyanobacterium stanieri PCC 7202]